MDRPLRDLLNPNARFGNWLAYSLPGPSPMRRVAAELGETSTRISWYEAQRDPMQAFIETVSNSSTTAGQFIRALEAAGYDEQYKRLSALASGMPQDQALSAGAGPVTPSSTGIATPAKIEIGTPNSVYNPVMASQPLVTFLDQNQTVRKTFDAVLLQRGVDFINALMRYTHLGNIDPLYLREIMADNQINRALRIMDVIRTGNVTASMVTSALNDIGEKMLGAQIAAAMSSHDDIVLDDEPEPMPAYIVVKRVDNTHSVIVEARQRNGPNVKIVDERTAVRVAKAAAAVCQNAAVGAYFKLAESSTAHVNTVTMVTGAATIVVDEDEPAPSTAPVEVRLKPTAIAPHDDDDGEIVYAGVEFRARVDTTPHAYLIVGRSGERYNVATPKEGRFRDVRHARKYMTSLQTRMPTDQFAVYVTTGAAEQTVPEVTTIATARVVKP